jgi:hypothetical protein
MRLTGLACLLWLGAVQLGAQESRHWAYVKPVRPELPSAVDRDWVRDPIDHFIAARIKEQGLTPNLPAERPRLFRRLHLDLIGLPPTVGELDAYLADSSADAYEKVVDRLLASPRYGEHWARQWLDLARYADSNGFQADQLRDSWAYRDWVIEAMNADMPFDQFTIEQLAGDLLANATPSQKIGTGFHRTVTCNVEAGVHPEENRVNQIFDRVNTTATVWLGTTMECAQCHKHKYDPFDMKDYYGLFAFFNNTPLEVQNKSGKGVTFSFWGPKMELPLLAEQVHERAKLQKQRKVVQQRQEAAMEQIASGQSDWEARMVKALRDPPRWHVLEIETFTSTGDEDVEFLQDKSVLVGGRVPGTATYTATVKTDLVGISAFRVETLTHPSLPGTGPGRSDDARPNFILSEFVVTSAPTADASVVASEVTLHTAQADYSQKNWHVAQAIDGDARKGWAVGGAGFFKDHWASFRTREPLAAPGGTTLTFTLDQNYGRGRTIGRLRLSALTGDADVLDVPEKVRAAILKKKQTGKDRKLIADHFTEQQPQLADLKQQLADLGKKISAIAAPTTLVMTEMDKPRETRVMERGSYLDQGSAVAPSPPRVLHAWRPQWPKNRLGLARWLVDRDNPLVARVIVNRWWSQFFGQGIVVTEEDFGSQGESPTHPQLLDWLAVEFMESGWSMKRLHRRIVTSASYRQSSHIHSKAEFAKDPGNRFMARGARFRLSAEAIRDNALRISGLLTTKMGGPPVYPPQPGGLWRQTGRNEPKYIAARGEDRFRRGVYVIWRRAAPYPSFVNFDGPDRSACHPRRSRTNTPMQALTLMNDQAYVEMALGLGARVLRERPKASLEEQLTYAFRSTLARGPTRAEGQHLKDVFERERDRFRSHPDVVNKILGGIGGLTPDKKLDRFDLAAWLLVSQILLNLDETITRG